MPVVRPTKASAGLAPSLVLFTCLFAAQGALLVLTPILTEVADEFGVSTAGAAQLRSVSGITAGVAALILAVRGRRLTGLLYTGLALLAVGSLASALAPTFSVLLAAQVVIGLGLARVLSGGLAASEGWAGDGEGARLLSWALVGQPVAWIVGQPVAGAVAGAGNWRWAWVAVPFASALIALVAVAARRRVFADEARECDPLGYWRLAGVRSWAWGELAAYAAWAGTLVYAGALFIESYGADLRLTGLILGLIAGAYLPGNFLARRWLRTGSQPSLLGFALAAAVSVAILGGLRIGLAFSTIILALLAFFAGGRTIAGAALGLQLAQGKRLAAMSVRTAMLQFGYLFGAAIGGIVLPLGGFSGLGWTFAGLFAIAASVHARKVLTVGATGLRAASRQLRRHGDR